MCTCIVWNTVCQTDIFPLYSGRCTVRISSQGFGTWIQSWGLEVGRVSILDLVGLDVSAFTFGTFLYHFEMSLFSMLYMTTVLIHQFCLHFVLDKDTLIGTWFDRYLIGQKFCTVLGKVFTNLSFRFLGEYNRDNIIWIHCGAFFKFMLSLYIFFYFSFIYARIFVYFQLIAHLFVNMYIMTCATCLVE